MVMSDQRRTGDRRPLKHPPGMPLTARRGVDHPFRWLPRHGEPYCVVEWLTQTIARLLVYLPVYVAVVVTVTLILIWRTQ